MQRISAGRRFMHWLRAELEQFTKVNRSDRRWHMPLAAALASGLPLVVGEYFKHLDYGLVSALGGIVFLYLPKTPMHHRMVQLMAAAFGMVACYAFGVMGHFVPLLLTPVLAFMAMLVSMVCRFYRLGPPGSVFFVMAAAIGAFTPVAELDDVPLRVGLLAMGCLLACVVAFFYSVLVLRIEAPQPVEPLPPPQFGFVVQDSVMIGAFVGLSLALAQLLHLERAYWVPVSCLAVIQGASLRAVWDRQLHRIAGTLVGLLLSWGLLSLPLDHWGICLMVIGLSFIVEVMVVRHYGFAAVFITPLTLFLAEAATLGQGSLAALIQARLLDTVLGCLVGWLGGFCIHNPRIHRAVERQLRRLIPSRLLR